MIAATRPGLLGEHLHRSKEMIPHLPKGPHRIRSISTPGGALDRGQTAPSRPLEEDYTRVGQQEETEER